MSPKVRHILLIAISVGLPILAVVQDALGCVQLGAWGSVGVIAAGIVAVLTNVSNIWKVSEEEKAKAKKIVAFIGTAASLTAPILTAVYTSLPSTTKGLGFIAALAGLAVSLKRLKTEEPSKEEERS